LEIAMTLKHAILPLLFAVFSLGCPDSLGCSDGPPVIEPDDVLGFGIASPPVFPPIEAGAYGNLVWIRSFPEWMDLPRSKAILKGPGNLYYLKWDYSDFEITGHGVQKEYPWEEIADTYYSNGMYLNYRPPSNEDVPPEGLDVTFACEVLNPITKKWDRSPDYTRRVVRRDKPMNFYISPSLSIYELYEVYGPDNSFSGPLTVVSGETRKNLGLETSPAPADDVQLQVGLSGPDGYAGQLGALEMTWWERNWGQPETRGYNYTAPAGLAEPVDIVATFSILDPWTKERRTRELTFHVVPKGQE
jgi:hypothetical protein